LVPFRHPNLEISHTRPRPESETRRMIPAKPEIQDGHAGGSILDRAISVRFFRITRSDRQQIPFFERLLQIQATAEDQRTQRISDVDYWFDKITSNGNIISGRFCRVQSTNLPPRVSHTRRLEPLGVGEIGPNTVWQFDGTLAYWRLKPSRTG
jgi:hypothetical protein